MLRIAFILLIFTGFKPTYRVSKVSEKIIEFSLQNLGKKVDTGECWDLANKALTYAEADWEPPFKFGTKLDYPKQELKPADILQFTNIKLKFPNGTMSFPKHTAIVYKANGKKVTLLQQNFNNKRYVDTLTISMDYIKSGKVEAYRPKAKIG
jgi:hypothetical protein